MNITVFCSSSNGCNPLFTEAANMIGTWIGKHHHTLVYGGSDSGLMGAVSVAASNAGAKIIGVEPDVPFIQERASKLLTETVLTSSMAERKTVMTNMADAFIVLPGGPGTLDELTDILCLKSIGTLPKPIVIFDVNGFYDGFVSFLNTMVSNGVAQKSIHSLYAVAQSEDDLNALLR